MTKLIAWNEKSAFGDSSSRHQVKKSIILFFVFKNDLCAPKRYTVYWCEEYYGFSYDDYIGEMMSW